jgi:hypothetical protein
MSCIYIFSAVSESTSKLISLEQVSASSTKRIHYKRFTQGKDLSLASSSDMDSILGRRKVKNVGSDLAPVSAASSNFWSAGVTTVSRMHSSDYFSQKLASKGLNQKLMLRGSNDSHQGKKGSRTKRLKAHW